MFFVCSLSNSMIVTITRIESACLIGAHTQGGLYTKHEIGFQSQSLKVTTWHWYTKPNDQHPIYSQELLSTSKGIVVLPFRWPNHTTTSGCDDLCNIISRLHTAVGVRSLTVDWNGLHLIQHLIPLAET